MIKIIFTHIYSYSREKMRSPRERSEINRERGDGLTQKESGAVELELMNGRRSEEVRGGGFLSWGRRWIWRVGGSDRGQGILKVRISL